MPIVPHLIADTFGSHVGKYSERLKVTQNGETLQQAPLMHLQSVTIGSMGVSISADAIAACCERGIPILFIDQRGEVYASLYSAGLTGTVLTRRAQLLAYTDARGGALALAISAGKLINQAATLRYWERLRRENAPDDAYTLSELAEEIEQYARRLHAFQPLPIAEMRESIMAVEGSAARIYWEGVQLLIPEPYGWPGRAGRGATDPINSLLNYGYGILYGEIERAVILAGLDPYAGFLHADRPGKPSLVLDLIEEFRQAAVDRPVIGLAARRYTIERDAESHLSAETRRDFAGKILAHLDTAMRYENGRVALRHIIQMQARRVATYLRGEYDAYLPFVAES